MHIRDIKFLPNAQRYVIHLYSDESDLFFVNARGSRCRRSHALTEDDYRYRLRTRVKDIEHSSCYDAYYANVPIIFFRRGQEGCPLALLVPVSDEDVEIFNSTV